MRPEARGTRWAFALAGAFALAACDEIPQNGAKSFTGPAETRTQAAALSERTHHQNEYLRTGAAKR